MPSRRALLFDILLWCLSLFLAWIFIRQGAQLVERTSETMHP